MTEWCVIRTTEVVDGTVKLPRPKITRQVLMIGPKQDAERFADAIFDQEQNKSTDQIEVRIEAKKYNGQKTGTSARPGNGSRS